MEILIKLCPGVAGIFFFIALFFILVYFVSGMHRLKGKTKGKITEVFTSIREASVTDETNSTRVEKRGNYSYTVDGKTYLEQRPISGLKRKGSKVTVWYDPKNPSKSAIGKGHITFTIVLFLVLAAAFAAAPLILRAFI